QSHQSDHEEVERRAGCKDALGLAAAAAAKRQPDAFPRAAGPGADAFVFTSGRRLRGQLSKPAPTSTALRALGTTALVAVRRPESLDRARAELEAELEAVDRACSRFRDDSELFRLNQAAGEEMEVGPSLLGATAKALAADRAARAAAESTDDGVIVCLGGDVAVAGDSPAAGWSVGLADDHAAPFPADGPAVGIRSGGLATSGTCVRSWATA